VNKYTLNVCFPTYCRGDQFFEDIKSLLTNKDKRFRVTIQDNHSEDGSFEALQKIDDSRLILYRNESNLTGIPNTKLALANNSGAEYLLFSIDKDYVDPKYISEFIDYLEKENPVFGYLDLYRSKGQPAEHYSAGVDALKKIGYLCKHPSGYFWRNDVYTRETNKNYFKNLPMKFDWWFDLLTAHFAAEYPGVIVHIPVFIHAIYRPEYMGRFNPTLSYNEENIYFGFSKRMEDFELCVYDLINLDLNIKIKQHIAFIMAYRLVANVTINLRNLYHNKRTTKRYNLINRTITWSEMFGNTSKALKLYISLMMSSENILPLLGKSFLLLGWSVLRTAPMCIKEFFRKSNLK